MYKTFIIIEEKIRIIEKQIRQFKFPIIYFTKSPHTHYSILKISSLYKLKSVTIKNNNDGSMNLKHLSYLIKLHSIKFNLSPIILIVNMGTTITGAIDNIPEILKILKKSQINFSIHMDAAMLGSVLPLIIPYKNIKNYFKDLKIDTISISGHKFFGSSQITGIACVEKKFLFDSFNKKHNYIKYTGNLHDITISGSRSGFNILLLHNIMCSLDMDSDYHNLRFIINKCFENVKYLYDSLLKILKKDNIMLLKKQFNILFPRPSNMLQKKYTLMPVLNKYSSIIVTAKVTKNKINSFIKDYKLERSL